MLKQEHTTESYISSLNTRPRNSQENIRSAINNFIKFTKTVYEKSPDEVCLELIKIRKDMGNEEYEQTLYEVLQKWIDWNVENNVGSFTIQTRFSIIRSYLYYLRIKTDLQDIKQLLRFPRKVKEEKYPLKVEELRNLVLAQSRNPKRQALYLTCSSSGMRIGEALQIRKDDLDFSHERIMISLDAIETKQRSGLTTFVSKECQDLVMRYYDKLERQEYVFTNSEGSIKNRERTEQSALARARNALGYTEKYSSNNYAHITTHSFRAYFFTRAARKIGEDYAQIMTGHGGYLLHEYDRMSIEEKLEHYLKLEPELVVFDNTKKELEVEKLKQENKGMQELKDEFEKLKKSLAKQDKMIVENLRKDGKIQSIS